MTGRFETTIRRNDVTRIQRLLTRKLRVKILIIYDNDIWGPYAQYLALWNTIDCTQVEKVDTIPTLLILTLTLTNAFNLLCVYFAVGERLL